MKRLQQRMHELWDRANEAELWVYDLHYNKFHDEAFRLERKGMTLRRKYRAAERKWLNQKQ